MQTESQNDVDTLTWLARVKKLFQRDSVTSDFHPKLYLITQCVFAGSLAGFILGGRIGARIGALEHIENTQLAVYQSSTHAQREYHSRVVVGFFRNGSKFGWRAGMFAGVYSLLLVIFSETEQNRGLSFLAAGACTGVIYKSLAGWRPMLVGAVIGSGLSLPVAGITGLIDKYASDEVKEKLDVFATSYTPNPSEDSSEDAKSFPEDTGNIDDVIKSLEDTLVEYEQCRSVNDQETIV